MSGAGRTIIPAGATLNVANASAVTLTGGRTLEFCSRPRQVGFHPIDESQRIPETGPDEVMEAASDIRRSAFLGNYLPRQCGMATFTCEVLSAARREFQLAPWNKERKTLLTLGAFYSTGRAQTWLWTRRECRR